MTNLSQCGFAQRKYEKIFQYTKEAYEKDISDPVKRLILDSNMLMENYRSGIKSYRQVMNEAKKLIKKEKKILGANQTISIFNFYIMSTASYNNVSAGDDFAKIYIQKALRLNQKTHQYKDIEANLYNEMSYYYYFRSSENFEKALEYRNKCIEVLENWQTKDHYDLLTSYTARASYYSFRDDVKAIEDYKTALARCSSNPELACLFYLELGSVYERINQLENATECFARTYYLWQKEDFDWPEVWNPQILEVVYDKLENPNLDFTSWSEEQIKQAEEDLKKEWGESWEDDYKEMNSYS